MKRIFSFLFSELGRIILGLAFFIPAFLLEHFSKPDILPFILFLISLFVSGLPVFIGAFRGILRRELLDEKFLMCIASVGAIIIGEVAEGVAVMLFFLVGEFFEHKAVAHSRKSIKALMDICPDEARVIINGKEEILDSEDVGVGAVIVIRAGERVPLDATVISGSADVNVSHLTGESIPVSVSCGSLIQSGSIVLNGVLTAKAIHTAENSSAGRILALVEEANERKSKTEAFITSFSHYYTPTVVILAVLLAAIPPIFGWLQLSESVYRALTFLVISCPCALVISVPMAFFSGIGGAASKGVLFKGGNVFSALAKADTFIFDKTGTLTSGSFTVSKIIPIGISESDFLHYLASAESQSNHPIAISLKASTDNISAPESVNEIAGQGVDAIIDGHRVLCGNTNLLSSYEIDIPSEHKNKNVFLALDGVYCGCVAVSDSIKPEASMAVSSLRDLGAKKIVMLSGDKREKAEKVGNSLSFDSVLSELSPEEKYNALEVIIKESKHTVYVGDGINDAPAIARSDVGVAMGGVGSDSAIESADVVITSDNLMRLPLAVLVARKTLGISIQNIVFALGIKLSILLLGALGIANMWLAVFADVGVAVIAILNSMRALSVNKKFNVGKTRHR